MHLRINLIIFLHLQNDDNCFQFIIVRNSDCTSEIQDVFLLPVILDCGFKRMQWLASLYFMNFYTDVGGSIT